MENSFLFNSFKRFVTSVVLLGVVYICLFFFNMEGVVFFILSVLFLSVFEWLVIVYNSVFRFYKKLVWLLAGLTCIISPCYILLLFSFCVEDIRAPFAIMTILSLSCMSDITSYFVGNIVGGPKICTAVSPNKTWSGAIGGIILTSLFGCIIIVLYRNSFISSYDFLSLEYTTSISELLSNGNILIVSIAVSIAAQSGDLLQSLVKRKFSIKNSGCILPGHGGVLDRLDSLFAVALLLFVLELFDYGVICSFFY